MCGLVTLRAPTPIRQWLAIAILAILLASTAHAAGRDARVRGTVVDAEGKRLEGVTVTIEPLGAEAEEAVREGTSTNRKGKFALILADGTQSYVIRFDKEGYQTLQDRLDPKVGQTLSRTWTMAAVEEGLQVSAEVAEAYERGIEALRAGDSTAARQAFETALAEDPRFAPGQQGLLLALLNLGEFEPAAELTTGLLASNPDDLLALRGAFDAEHELGRHQAAAGHLERLIALDPGPETALRAHNQAVYDAQNGDVEQSRALLEQAIEMDPTLGSAHLALATLHLDAEDYEQALAIAEELLASEPRNPDALSIRYEAYRRSGDSENVQRALEDLQSADPEAIADAFFQHGVMLYEDNQLEAAVNAFERVLSADPDDPKAHFMLGKVLTSYGDYEGAVVHLKRFIELAPDDPDVAEAEELIRHLQ